MSFRKRIEDILARYWNEAYAAGMSQQENKWQGILELELQEILKAAREELVPKERLNFHSSEPLDYANLIFEKQGYNLCRQEILERIEKP